VPVFQLLQLELSKLFRNLAFWLVAVVMILLTSYFVSVPANSYHPRVEATQISLQAILDSIDNGSPVLMGDKYPDWFSPEEYPLVDSSGVVIPENAEIYKQIAYDYFQPQIDALTAEGGEYSFSRLIDKGARQAIVFLVIFSMVMAVILITTGYHTRSYRLMVSRGAKRSDIITAKLITLAVVSVIYSILGTLILFGIVWIMYTNFDAPNPAVVSLLQTINVVWVFALTSLAYMAIASLIATLLASSTPAMLGSLVFAFISLGMFYTTPCDQGLLAGVSSVTLGYNIGSIMHEVFGPISSAYGSSSGGSIVVIGGQAEKCFRSVNLALPLAILYVSVFISLTYLIFRKKELKR
jgi:ABC-type transport system involved in multi-copper enzyme maturation permease subunit